MRYICRSVAVALAVAAGLASVVTMSVAFKRSPAVVRVGPPPLPAGLAGLVDRALACAAVPYTCGAMPRRDYSPANCESRPRPAWMHGFEERFYGVLLDVIEFEKPWKDAAVEFDQLLDRIAAHEAADQDGFAAWEGESVPHKVVAIARDRRGRSGEYAALAARNSHTFESLIERQRMYPPPQAWREDLVSENRLFFEYMCLRPDQRQHYRVNLLYGLGDISDDRSIVLLRHVFRIACSPSDFEQAESCLCNAVMGALSLMPTEAAGLAALECITEWRRSPRRCRRAGNAGTPNLRAGGWTRSPTRGIRRSGPSDG